MPGFLDSKPVSVGQISKKFKLKNPYIIKIIMYSNCAITLSNTCDLFSRIFEVFNEMEMEINVINNKNFNFT